MGHDTHTQDAGTMAGIGSGSGFGSFALAKLTDVTVCTMLKRGATLEEVIGALSAEKKRYVDRIMALESIAPRKVRMPDGSAMIWRCPEELIPEMYQPNTEMTNAEGRSP